MVFEMYCNLTISVQMLLMNYWLYAKLFSSDVNRIPTISRVISQSWRFSCPERMLEEKNFNLARHKKVVCICYGFTRLTEDLARERFRSKLFENA